MRRNTHIYPCVCSSVAKLGSLFWNRHCTVPRSGPDAGRVRCKTTHQEFVPRRSGPLLRVGKEKACVPDGLRDHARVGREKQPGWKQLRPPKKSARPHPPRSRLSPECGHPNQPMTSPPTGCQRRGLRKKCSFGHPFQLGLGYTPPWRPKALIENMQYKTEIHRKFVHASAEIQNPKQVPKIWFSVSNHISAKALIENM